MITPEHEEMAALYALDLLEADVTADFEAACRRDPALTEMVDELRNCAALLAYQVPPCAPPAGLWERIATEISDSKKTISIPTPPAQAKLVFPHWVPWALAAVLAICCGVLFLERQEAPGFPAELSVAVLSATGDAPTAEEAVVVWDPATQTGRLDLARMPRLESDRDYQLWVIDPRYADPVDGGVFAISGDGTAHWVFHPKAQIAGAPKFAISIEPEGGSVKAQGPIIMASR